jgi:hypothetical protein
MISHHFERKKTKAVTRQLWRALLLVHAILAGVMVGMATYGHRYRHYGFTRYLLPLVENGPLVRHI